MIRRQLARWTPNGSFGVLPNPCTPRDVPHFKFGSHARTFLNSAPLPLVAQATRKSWDPKTFRPKRRFCTRTITSTAHMQRSTATRMFFSHEPAHGDFTQVPHMHFSMLQFWLWELLLVGVCCCAGRIRREPYVTEGDPNIWPIIVVSIWFSIIPISPLNPKPQYITPINPNLGRNEQRLRRTYCRTTF